MNPTEMKEILLKVKQAFKANDEAVIAQIKDAVATGKSTKEFFEAYPELKEVFDAIGTSPLEAPDLYVAEQDFELSEYIDVVEKALGLDLASYDIEDALTFAGMVWTRVNSFRDESGHIKSTPNTENAKMPTTKSLLALSKLDAEKREAFDKTRSGFDPDLDDYVDFAEEVQALEEYYRAKELAAVLEITGLDGSVLSEWEKKLLVADVKAYTKDSVARGKMAFKGYL